ncbi:MAG: energy transducer TonB [Methylophaga sp.]|nr:MAG: energy transducer TonB [Methylophaga sp.]
MRLIIGLMMAILVNIGLFTLMQQMTTANSVDRRVTEDIRLLDFVRLKRENRIETKKRELPKKPPPPQKPPPPPKTPVLQAKKPKAPTPKLDVPQIDVPLNIAGGPYLGDFATGPKVAPAAPAAPVVVPVMDDEVIPLVRIPPRYPRSASRRGIEGVVVVSFTITKDGQVTNPIVESAKPENTFNKAALKAILKWKFKPKIVGGKPVERQATQEIEFKLAK